MMTISEVATLTGVSQRTLHYYDEIGLLPPTQTTDAGYRLYDDAALERLQHILLFKELGFPLRDIRSLLDDPAFDRTSALEQHLKLLMLRKQHLENLIDLTRGLCTVGTNHLDFSAFDHRSIDEYAAEARATYGKTAAYKEYEQRFLSRSEDDQSAASQEFMALLGRFGTHLGEAPDSPEVQALVGQLQGFITEHFYTCTDQILASFANLYDGGGRFTQSIDKAGGPGTAALAAQAIRCYTRDI
ncbi:MAG: MerR family transcriptional regulator [Clostridiales bacterium]|nr:MerR family transcriptional regulator [Clostridiales bacterium]